MIVWGTNHKRDVAERLEENIQDRKSGFGGRHVKVEVSGAVEAHIFNPSTWEAETRA